MATDIRYGETRDLVFVPTDDGVAQTGASAEILIRRLSDGFSWNGAAFDNASNWEAMTEVTDGGGNTGQYIYNFTFPSSDIDYQVLYRVTALEILVSEDIYVRDIPDQSAIIATIGTHDTDIKALIGTPSPDLVTDIQTAESNIRGADSDDLKDISDEIAASEVAIRGSDNDDLKDISDQIDGVQTDATTIVGKLPDNNIMGSSVKTDKDDELDDIYAKVDAATPSPTIPAQITTHDTDIKALPRMEACPDLMYVPGYRTLINVEGGISDTDTEIPVLIATNLLTTGLVKIESEYIIYDGIVDSKLQVTQRGAYSTTPVAHNNNVIVSQSIVYPVRLVIFDNAGNMVDADSAPTIEIEDWKGTQELAPTAMTSISTGVYGYDYIIDFGEVPENKLFIFSATVDSKTREIHHEVVIINQPASSIELAQIGGGMGLYPCTQEGWYDLDGILHEWGDNLQGVVEDADTGAPLFRAYVTAYLIENNEVLYNGRPPGQAKTRVNGTWLMFLDAETYQFVIEKDGFRIREDGTETRTVG